MGYTTSLLRIRGMNRPLLCQRHTMKHPFDCLLSAPSASIRLAAGLGLVSLAGLSAPSVVASTCFADISLTIVLDAPPPPPNREVIVGVSPGPDYIWIGGYWDGEPGHYRWVGGRWGRPPHSHGQWVAPHWDKDREGHYHQTKGEWRDGPKDDRRDDHRDGPKH